MREAFFISVSLSPTWSSYFDSTITCPGNCIRTGNAGTVMPDMN